MSPARAGIGCLGMLISALIAGCGGSTPSSSVTSPTVHGITFATQDLGTAAFAGGNIPYVSLNASGMVIVGRGGQPGSLNAILIDSSNPSTPVDLGVQLNNVYISNAGTMAGDMNSESSPQMVDILTSRSSSFQVQGQVYDLANSGIVLVNNVGAYSTYNGSGPVSVLPAGFDPFAIAQGASGTLYALGESGLNDYSYQSGQSSANPGAFGAYQVLEMNDHGDVLTTGGLLDSFTGQSRAAAPRIQIGGNAGWSQPNLSSNVNEQVIGATSDGLGNYTWQVYDFTLGKAFPITIAGYTVFRAGAINSNNQFLVDAVPNVTGPNHTDHLLLVTEQRQ